MESSVTLPTTKLPASVTSIMDDTISGVIPKVDYIHSLVYFGSILSSSLIASLDTSSSDTSILGPFLPLPSNIENISSKSIVVYLPVSSGRVILPILVSS